jgi:hypothetical protein
MYIGKQRVAIAKTNYEKEGYTIVSHHPDNRYVVAAKQIMHHFTNDVPLPKAYVRVAHTPMSGPEKVSVYSEKELLTFLEILMYGDPSTEKVTPHEG